MRLSALVNELPVLRDLPPGPCEVLFAIGGRGAGPDAAAVERALQRGAPRGR